MTAFLQETITGTHLLAHCTPLHDGPPISWPHVVAWTALVTVVAVGGAAVVWYALGKRPTGDDDVSDY